MDYIVTVINFGGNLSNHHFFNKPKAMSFAQNLIDNTECKSVMVWDEMKNEVIFDFYR